MWCKSCNIETNEEICHNHKGILVQKMQYSCHSEGESSRQGNLPIVQQEDAVFGNGFAPCIP